MPRINNDLLHGAKGAIGKNIVYKTRNNKTFVSKYPDMSHVKASQHQTKNRNIFAEAVSFASELIKDPVRAAAFKAKKGETVYLAAVKHYMRLHPGSEPAKDLKTRFWREELLLLGLTDRQLQTALFIQRAGMLTNADCQRLHNISKPTATRDLQVLITKNLITSSGRKGSGAVYQVGSWWAQKRRKS